uniref:Uncharacterized protein n=1 Tax=Magallana gigas TaxID=29159 RepID=A0A8W8MJX4_MAGGI
MVLSIRRFDSAKSDVSKDVNGFIKRELQEPSNTEDEKRFQPTELKPFGKWQSNNYIRLSGGGAKQKSPRMVGYWRRPSKPSGWRRPPRRHRGPRRLRRRSGSRSRRGRSRSRG